MPAPIVEPVFLPNQGIDLRKPEQFLSKYVSPYSRNMEFYNQLMQGRLGLSKFDNAQLSGPVTLIKQYWQFSGSYALMFFTTKDIYKYDFGNTRFDILTPTYTTGTIEVQVGTPTIVRGTGTTWSTNLKAGDFIKIGAGSIHTGSTWYTIQSVDSNVQLTLTAAAPTTAAGTAYVARKTFTGTTTDQWQAVEFLDSARGAVIIATNGIDAPVWYNASGQVQTVTGFAASMTTAKYIGIFYNRIIWAWTREVGANQPIRVRWSAVGDFQTYRSQDVADLELPDAQYWIKGLYVQGDYLIIPKEKNAYVVSWVGGDAIFDFVFGSTFAGNFAATSIIPYLNGAYYFGTDYRFRFWNLVRDETPFENIFPYLVGIDANNSQYIYGYEVKSKKQLRFTLPYDTTLSVSPMIVYDYENGGVEIWEYKLASTQWIRCMGEFLNVQDLYVDDPLWANLYVDENVGFWDDRTFLANAPQLLYGCEDGYVRKADITTADDGTAYDRTIRLSRMDFRLPHIEKRLHQMEVWLQAQAAGTVTLRLKRDDAVNFEAGTKTLNHVSTLKDVVKAMVRWDKQAENFEFELTAQNHFALLGFLAWLFRKQSKMS